MNHPTVPLPAPERNFRLLRSQAAPWRQVAVALLLFTSVLSPASEPQIRGLSPLALTLEQTNLLALTGSNLSPSDRLWTSFPAAVVPPADASADNADQVRFAVVLPSESQVALGAVRVFGSNGVSNLRLIMIDDLTTLKQPRGNQAREKAQTLPTPTAVDGRTSELALDYYRLPARTGQALSFEVVAQRIGSKLDPVLRLLNAQGRELAYVDDEPALGTDARFRYVFPTDGDYTLELRDINYGGGNDFDYRLRIADFPLVSVAYPWSVTEPGPWKAAVLGRAIEGIDGIRGTLSEEATGMFVSVKYPEGRHASSLVMSRVTGPLTTETEPNDAATNATSFSPPGALAGRLERDGDRDCFAWEGRKDQRVAFRAQTRAAGSPCDLWMQVQKEDGTKVATAKATEADDGSVTAKLPEDGRYLLVVEEINRLGGPDFAYQIEATPFEPNFELTTDVDHVNTSPGGTFETKVTVTRSDYEGAIELTVSGLGDDLKLEGQTIEEKKNETTLKVTLPDRFAPGQMELLSILGHARIGDRDVSQQVSIRPALQKAFPLTRTIPPGLDHVIALGITLGK